MKANVMNIDLTFSSARPARRRVGVLAALFFGLSAAFAQNAVTTVAGTAGTPGFANGTGAAATFRLSNPSGVALDAAGNLYVADAANHAIRVVTAAGVVTTLAGSGSAGSANGTGTAASFNSPQGVAIDGAGNVYVADTGNHLIRMITPAGTVLTIAGSAGASGYVNSIGIAARFNQPLGIAVDRAGTGGAALNIFVADTQNNAIRRIVISTGTVSTLAGSSTGAAGNLNGGNTAALFNRPSALVTNAAGDVLYVADTSNHSIRAVVITAGSTATVATLAGSGVAGYVEGSGTNASFNSPAGITLDASGNILVSDAMNHLIRSITPAGVTTAYAGSAGVAGSTDGLPLAGARFNLPSGIAASASGALVADTGNHLIRRITSTTFLAPVITLSPASQSVGIGQAATFSALATGNPAPSYQWQRQRPADTGFVSLPEGGGFTGTNTATLTISEVTAAMAGDLFRVVASNPYGSVSSSSAQLGITPVAVFSTLAGQPGVMGAADGAGSAVQFRAPTAVAVDAAGNTYVADAANHTIRKITSAGVVTTLAGSAGLGGAVDGVGGEARFNTPGGVAVDTAGNLYVADTGNHTIRLVSPNGTVSTFAGAPALFGATDGVVGVARFWSPAGIAVDSFGTVYVADTFNHVIRKITAGTLVTTLAGQAGTPGAADGAATVARFNLPNHVAVDPAFNVYVADTGNHAIRKISPAGDVVTLAGLAGAPGSVNGTGAAARFNQPRGLAVDAAGGVTVADTGNHTIRRITPAGETVTLAGAAGLGGSTDGAGSLARFNQPYGLALDAAGSIYVADTYNHLIRRSAALQPPRITTQPQNQLVGVGGNVSFTVVASGSPAPTFQWQRRAAGTDPFVDLTDGGNYSGTTTATLSVNSVTAAMVGDEFRVVASNFVNPPATSSGATLSIATPPVITSAPAATFRALEAGSFTVAAPSTLPVTFSATGLPAWATLNSTTGVLSGTPPDTTGSPFAITLTANVGTGASTATTQAFVLTVEPPQVAPTLSAHPTSVTVNRGENATFSVTAFAAPAPTYQWRKDGGAINGATNASYTVANAQPASSGRYSVTVSNPYGTVTSTPAVLLVNTPPIVTGQPRSQTTLAGGTVTFAIDATAVPDATYQWRRNGVAIPGANAATLTVANVGAGEAGNYDVTVTNPLGQVRSSVAQLTIATGVSAPVFTLQPASRSVVAGVSTTLSAAAMGAPAPVLQWRRNGTSIPGATAATLSLANVQPADTGSYDVVATNSAGNTISAPAVVRVMARSYAGIYFGEFGGGLGNFGLSVREDNSGVFVGYLPALGAPVLGLALSIDDAGQFTFSQGPVASAAARETGEPARAAELNPVLVTGTISPSGTVSGSVAGGVTTSLSGNRVPDIGPAQSTAGFYQAGTTGHGGVAYAIVTPAGQVVVALQAGSSTDGGAGTVNSGGQISVAAARSVIVGAITPASGGITLTASGGLNGTFTGANDAVLATQRLLNISSRARVGSGETVAIAGFVIAGEESKPVLIRAVGPTLASAPFNVLGSLPNPKLDLHRLAGGTPALVATNTGIAGNRTAIDAAGAHIGAFPLGGSGADAALLTTLAPGNYTATVSSATTNTGVALIEVYDLSAAAAGQKLLNISTRATAGSAENTLIAGVVVAGSAPKRVLIRGIGPGLGAFGVAGVLAQPALALFNQAGQVVATNTNWTTSADAAAIAAASARVGAFGLANLDSALIVTLAPGNYTAQVNGPGTATGVALIEVYEIP